MRHNIAEKSKPFLIDAKQWHYYSRRLNLKHSIDSAVPSLLHEHCLLLENTVASSTAARPTGM